MNGRNTLMAALACLGLLGVSSGWIYVHHSNKGLQTQLISKQHQVDQAQQSIKSKRHQVNNQFLNSAPNNPDAKISSVFLQNQATQQVSRATAKFFSTYYSFNSSTDYDSRKNILLNQGIIDKSLANDRKIFNSDKIAKGMNYVDVSQLHSQYISSYSFLPPINKHTNSLNYLTQVKFQSNYSDQKAATSTMIYKVNYDLTSHKISRVSNESSLFKNTNTLSNLKSNHVLDNY